MMTFHLDQGSQRKKWKKKKKKEAPSTNEILIWYMS
jgi:hypothetical protein